MRVIVLLGDTRMRQPEQNDMQDIVIDNEDEDEAWARRMCALVCVCDQPTTGEAYAILKWESHDGTTTMGAPTIVGAYDLTFLSTQEVVASLKHMGVQEDTDVWLEDGDMHCGMSGSDLFVGVEKRTYLYRPIDPPGRISIPEVYAAVATLQEKEDDSVLRMRMCARCAGPVKDENELLCSECRE